MDTIMISPVHRKCGHTWARRASHGHANAASLPEHQKHTLETAKPGALHFRSRTLEVVPRHGSPSPLVARCTFGSCPRRTSSQSHDTSQLNEFSGNAPLALFPRLDPLRGVCHEIGRASCRERV